MHIRIVAVIGWLALHLAPGVHAQSDLGVSRSESQIPGSFLVTPLRTETIRYIVTNNGPGPLAGIAIDSTPLNAANIIIELVPSACAGAEVETAGGFSVFRWRIQSLAAGAAVACSIAARAAPATVPGTASFTLVGVAAGNADPNSFNNGVTAGFVFSAIDAPVDVRIAARMDPGGILRQGVPQRLRVTVTNVGTTVVPAVTVLSPGYNQAAGFIGFAGYDLFEITETAPCFMIVDAEPPFVFFVAMGFDDAPLPPGASRTCTVGIRALPGALGVGMAELPLDLFPRGTGVYDIAPQDNSAIVRVDYGTIPPRAVPLSPVSWFIAIASIALLGVWAARRRDRERKADGFMRQA